MQNYNEQMQLFINEKARINDDYDRIERTIRQRAQNEITEARNKRDNALILLCRKRDEFELQYIKQKHEEKLKRCAEYAATMGQFKDVQIEKQ